MTPVDENKPGFLFFRKKMEPWVPRTSATVSQYWHKTREKSRIRAQIWHKTPWRNFHGNKCIASRYLGFDEEIYHQIICPFLVVPMFESTTFLKNYSRCFSREKASDRAVMQDGLWQVSLKCKHLYRISSRSRLIPDWVLGPWTVNLFSWLTLAADSLGQLKPPFSVGAHRIRAYRPLRTSLPSWGRYTDFSRVRKSTQVRKPHLGGYNNYKISI